MGRHELIDGTVTDDERYPASSAAELNGGQRPFRLQHEADPTRVYALGVELDSGALVMWLDPFTGYQRVGGFLSAGDALCQFQRQFGPETPLLLVWDERPPEPDLPRVEEELPLTKARVAWPDHAKASAAPQLTQEAVR